jgi:hypothetical protein
VRHVPGGASVVHLPSAHSSVSAQPAPHVPPQPSEPHSLPVQSGWQAGRSQEGQSAPSSTMHRSRSSSHRSMLHATPSSHGEVLAAQAPLTWRSSPLQKTPSSQVTSTSMVTFGVTGVVSRPRGPTASQVRVWKPICVDASIVCVTVTVSPGSTASGSSQTGASHPGLRSSSSRRSSGQAASPLFRSIAVTVSEPPGCARASALTDTTASSGSGSGPGSSPHAGSTSTSGSARFLASVFTPGRNPCTV